MTGDARRLLVEKLDAMQRAASSLGIVDFNERKQEFFCRVCRYRDPLGPDGNKLHDDNCQWLEFVNRLDMFRSELEATLSPEAVPSPRRACFRCSEAAGALHDTSKHVTHGLLEPCPMEASPRPAEAVPSAPAGLSACPFGDATCPCQDGDPCNHVEYGIETLPSQFAELRERIAAMLKDGGIHHYNRRAAEIIKGRLEAEAVPSAPAGLRARAEALLAKVTPGEWCVWNGHGYIGGGEDLCIGAGKTWLANMDHRHCQNYAHHIGCHDDGCRLEGDADICSVGDEVTAEQRANADFIAAAPQLVRDLLAALRAEDTP